MRQSKLFSKTQKGTPKDEVSKNAILLARAGFINKEMAGVYDLLPLGWRVVEKIKNIVRGEMDAIDAQEILMSSLQRKELWQETNRWSDEEVDIWFKSVLKSGSEVGLGWSHEEPITDMMKSFISSYRDLPIYVYQFQNKLRNELRAKSGIMRGREFLMKDLYTYTSNEEEHKRIYDIVTAAYLNIFNKVGIGGKTYLTLASGGAFTQFSHEFQMVSKAGEDTIYLDKNKKIAINKEIMKEEILDEMGLKKDDLEECSAIEIANIFSFGGAKSEALGLYFKDKSGESRPVILGSYGIGITRLMGAVAETFSDDMGLVWPRAISPFDVHLLNLGERSEDTASKIYKDLLSQGFEVLYDDRDLRAGEKFADADLIGISTRIVVGEKQLESGKLEVKDRASGKLEELTLDEINKKFATSKPFEIKE